MVILELAIEFTYVLRSLICVCKFETFVVKPEFVAAKLVSVEIPELTVARFVFVAAKLAFVVTKLVLVVAMLVVNVDISLFRVEIWEV